MELGVIMPSMSRRDGRPGDIPAAARHAEDLGFESAWVVDQLVAGTGVPVLDSLTSLAGAAAVTDRIRLGVGVLIAPLRPVTWTAKQVATLQYLSGDRVLLGVGAGGDRHAASWDAAGVPRRERGRRTDEALRRLPDLIAGKPVRLTPEGAEVTLSPGVTVPPLVIGGNSDAAARRAGEFGDEWFVLAGPDDIPRFQAVAAEQAGRFGRPVPALTTSVMVALDGDPSVPGRDTLTSLLADPDGMFGVPAEAAPDAFLTGGPAVLADLLGRLAEAGLHRTIVQFVGGDWSRQTELVAEARSQLG
ncbi:MAG TPA: LLM class flavin-dependent oxidoreductase [Streptosporangiaceae bacterium]|jgi:alkanesulfonate monooxygenase SsuD/methylene tetrahydromethanopterin reductase-like flavin-dependent oxidoreductase (luciferase family)